MRAYFNARLAEQPETIATVGVLLAAGSPGTVGELLAGARTLSQSA